MDAFLRENKDGLRTWHIKITLYGILFLQLLRVLRHPTNQKLSASAAHPWQWGGRVQGTSLPVWRLTTTTPSGSKRKEGRIRTSPNNHTLLAQIGLSHTSPDYISTRTIQLRLNLIANRTKPVRPEQVRVLLDSRLFASVSGSDKNVLFTTVFLKYNM